MSLSKIESVLRCHRRRMDLLRRYRASLGCACGEMRPECLDLHHRDPSTKNKKLTKSGRSRWSELSYEEIVEEVRKCDVVCSNCHRVHHANFKAPEPTRQSPRLRAAEIALGLDPA